MIYQIRIQGNMDPSWADWFNGMQILEDPCRERAGITTLSGEVRDQAALRGILNHLWDLNFSLHSVICINQEDRTQDLICISGEGSEP